METVVRYVPATRLPGVAVTVTEKGEDLPETDVDSQPEPVPFTVAVGTAIVPWPEFDTVTTCAAGAAPPTVAEKESEEGDSPMTGGLPLPGVPTVRVTGTASGVFAAPLEAMETVAW